MPMPQERAENILAKQQSEPLWITSLASFRGQDYREVEAIVDPTLTLVLHSPNGKVAIKIWASAVSVHLAQR